jgi:hypothetical protein
MFALCVSGLGLNGESHQRELGIFTMKFSCRRSLLCRDMHAALLGALAIGALVLASTPSFAASVSFTGSASGSALIYDPATDYSPSTGYSPPGSLGGYDGLIALHGFNTGLGTLNAVTLTTQVSGSLEFKDARAFGYATDIINATLYITGQTPYGGTGASVPFTFSSPGHGNGVIFDTGVQNGSSGPSSYTNNLSTTFAPFYVSTFFVPVLSYVYTTVGTNTSYMTDATATFAYQQTVTYDYTPAVAPLPAALPLFTTGVGALGLVGWRRKRKSASARAA